MPLTNWERVPGSAGRYRNKATGQTISRRQYENQRVAQSTPFKTLSEFNRVKREPKYQLYSRVWAEEKGVSTRTARRANSDFTKQYAQMKKENFNRKAGGAWANLLVDIGWRDEGALYNVGDTPKAGGY